MGKARVFGEQFRLSFFDGKQDNFIGEIDSFSSKDDDMLKENASLGDSQEDVTHQVIKNGGTMSFEAKKSDSKVIGMFITMQSQISASERGKGVLGKSPYFQVSHVIKYVDGSEEVVTYHGVTLHNYEMSVGGRTEEVSEKFEGKYKKKSLKVDQVGESAQALAGASLVQTAMSSILGLSGNSDEFTTSATPIPTYPNGKDLA